MSELFDLPESKSPRLQWMEKHGIEVSPPVTGCKVVTNSWMAFQRFGIDIPETCYGHTEDEAITQLALKLGIKLWNEEAANQTISA